jgi:hypothetical protein
MQDILTTLRQGHRDPIADRHYVEAADEIIALRERIKIRDEVVASLREDLKAAIYADHSEQ